MSMRVLITGANGQLGHALQLVLRGHAVFPFDHAGLDITNEAIVRRVIDQTRPEVVINAAAYNNVDRAESEPDAAKAVNETAPGVLSSAAASIGAVIVHVSTDYVFDGEKGAPYVESDPVNPLSVYGRTKLGGEAAARAANSRHFIVRTAWVYHTHGKNFLKTMLDLSKRQSLSVVSDQVSSPTYAPHLAEGIARLLNGQEFGTYHLAGGGQASRFEQLRAFFEAIGHSANLSPVKMDDFKQAARRPRHTPLATEKKPAVLLPDWKDGIREFARALTAGNAAR